MGRRRASTPADRSAGPGQPDSAPAGEPAGRHFAVPKSARLWLKLTALGLALVLVVAVGGAGFLLWRLQQNVHTDDLNAAVTLPKSTTTEDTGSMQILILGTDTRAGANSEYGTTADSGGSGNSDVMLLMNISADNSNVSITSFPRDLMVPIPACRNSQTGQVIPAQPMAQLNSALLEAGPGCTVAAINQLTGLTIDHFMLADFTAVKELSNAIGGVQVCVDHAMYDDNGSGLRLPAGKSLVQGEQALAFLRTRHAFGDASDLARIKAQQYFLGSLVRKIKTDGTLTNLPMLYNLANVVTKNLTIDKGLANIPDMISIATRLSKIDPANVAFITVPNEAWVQDSNRVQLKEPDAGQLFAGLRNDADFTGHAKASPSATAHPTAGGASGTPGATHSTAPSPAAPAAPAYDKAVQPIGVVNATGAPGRADDLLAALAKDGFTAAQNFGDVAAQHTTKIAYGPNMGDVAADVAKLFHIPASAVVSDPTVSGVQLVAGTDWISGTTFGKTELPKDIVSSTAAEKNECLVVNPLFYTN
ncbi:LCP family protein [Specibacter cremeus]|uniref:LCP family protein n=1 Tax=Specibacter cremeus TaxID=1629051 RepID=UPI000F7A6421|nr:LCP family protein [Specibacter cremeus]